MTSKTDSRTGRGVLMLAHCAGRVDRVALPVWVGNLISAHHFDPQQAGGLVTLCLVGALLASLLFAPGFNRISGRLAAPIGFGVSALAFLAASSTSDFASLAALRAERGFAAGTGLSFTHGTIGRSANPHRLFGLFGLFGLMGLALGIFAVFLGATLQIVAALGGPALLRLRDQAAAGLSRVSTTRRCWCSNRTRAPATSGENTRFQLWRDTALAITSTPDVLSQPAPKRCWPALGAPPSSQAGLGRASGITSCTPGLPSASGSICRQLSTCARVSSTSKPRCTAASTRQVAGSRLQ